MDGEKMQRRLVSTLTVGSPPRGRGKGLLGGGLAGLGGITPAWAGKRYGHQGPEAGAQVHPRVGGEKILPASQPTALLGSPPHRRGKMHLSLTLAYDTLHALTQFFNRVAFVDKLQNRSE